MEDGSKRFDRVFHMSDPQRYMTTRGRLGGRQAGYVATGAIAIEKQWGIIASSDRQAKDLTRNYALNDTHVS